MRVLARTAPAPAWSLSLYAAATLFSLGVTAALIAVAGAPIPDSFSALISGAAGSPDAIVSSVVKAAPLILTGLATCIAYRAGLWTVGQEGQVLAGAAAAWQVSLWTAGLPPVIALILCGLAGLIGGAALGGLAAWLKIRFEMSEIVSTMMLNYVVFYALSWLISGPWMAAGGTASYQQTSLLPRSLWLPDIAGIAQMHIGIIGVVIALVWLHLVLKRTPLGYEIRAMGLNATALSQRGTDMRLLIFKIMLISGAVSGLAGVGETFGVNHRLTGANLSGLGYEGIIIALIGGLTPIGTLLAGLFFGALHNGALFMNVMTGVPTALVTSIQGIVLILFLVVGVAARFRLVWRRRS
jgi:simple sugar transport system permease protein